jgi:hypothetical protein
MSRDTSQGTWQELALDVLTGMREWRQQHPKATFREIEAALDERMSRLRAQMLQDLAHESAAAHWSQLPEQDAPSCPTCGKPVVARGTHRRRVQTTGGREVTVERSYGTCPSCGAGFFPPR